ncbi:MAG: hypothetical protein QOH52_443 [Pseudonocardiales bacterium]|nr:hypothetical protein [Pseudonocardiales bacterium]
MAARTRAEVLSAASDLFVERGWSGTSIRDVARGAGVSVETVYASVGTKAELLKTAVEISVVGDDEPIPLAERPEFRALGEGDLAERVQALGRLMALLNPRTAKLHRVLQHAALSEPALAELLGLVMAQERESTRQGIVTLIGREGTDREIAGLQAVLSNDVYLLLTEHSGWDLETYQHWVADAVVRLLDLTGELT